MEVGGGIRHVVCGGLWDFFFFCVSLESRIAPSNNRGVVLDTTSEGPHSLFVQIVTRFVRIVTVFVPIMTKYT